MFVIGAASVIFFDKNTFVAPKNSPIIENATIIDKCLFFKHETHVCRRKKSNGKYAVVIKMIFVVFFIVSFVFILTKARFDMDSKVKKTALGDLISILFFAFLERKSLHEWSCYQLEA